VCEGFRRGRVYGCVKRKKIYMINALYMNLGRVIRVGFFKAQYEKRVRCSE
jgi:hypothetical protein